MSTWREDLLGGFARFGGKRADVAVVALFVSLLMAYATEAQAHVSVCSAASPCDEGVAYSAALSQENANAHCLAINPLSGGATKVAGVELHSTMIYKPIRFHCWNAGKTGYIAIDETDVYYFIPLDLDPGKNNLCHVLGNRTLRFAAADSVYFQRPWGYR